MIRNLAELWEKFARIVGVLCKEVWIQESIFKVIAKNLKGGVSAEKARKSGKTAKGRLKVAEYINCLSELHELQGVLFAQLKKEI